MLGWQKRTPFADRVEIDGREAVVTPTPFYDPEGHRARLERLVGPRVVADPAALDARLAGRAPRHRRSCVAPDDAFGIGADGVDVDDEHAIVVDEDGLRRAPGAGDR